MKLLFACRSHLLALLLLLGSVARLPAQTLSAGAAYTLAIHPDGTLWAWGLNDLGQLGDGSYTNRSSPIPIGTAANWRSIGGSGGIGVGNGRGDHALAVRSDGSLWGWGSNIAGQVGDNTTTTRNSPVRVGTTAGWQSASAGGYFSLAVRTDGTLWSWGRNLYGQLGDGSMTIRVSPAQVGTDTNWRTISAGNDHALAVRTDGTLWAWGRNQYGQLGDGTATNRLSPVQVGTATDWASVSAGGSHSLALRTDGSLWAWGSNGAGQIGDGTSTNRSSPVRIGSLTWKSIGASSDNTSSGSGHSLAVRADGTLWAWGLNGDGQLGIGSVFYSYRLSPVQSGTSTSWQRVSAGASHSVGEQACSAVWAWGSNQYGQVGDGSTTGPFAPVSIYGGGPGVLSFNPAAPAAGSLVTVTGTGLSNLTALSVNGANALPSVTNSTATSFQFVVPPTASASGAFALTSTCGSFTYAGALVLASRAAAPSHALAAAPNPASGSVLVSTDASGALVEVFDLRGRRVAQAETNAAGEVVLRLPPTLAAGIYLLRCGSQTIRLALE